MEASCARDRRSAQPGGRGLPHQRAPATPAFLKQHLKDRWGVRTFVDLEARLGDVFAAALDEVRYAHPTGDSNKARWPDDPIWRAVRQIISDALFDFTSNVTPQQVKRINRLEHRRILRENLFGTACSLATVDGVTPDRAPTHFRNIGAEFSLRAKENPDEVAMRMAKARERYVFL